MKKIAILGSTGSIGQQALQVVAADPENMSVTALTAGTNKELLAEQINRFQPKLAVIANEEDVAFLKERCPGTEILFGTEGLNAAATGDCDIVLNALLGIAGLEPTYHAVKAGKTIALANKETMVTGGELITEEAKKNGVKIMPVDSEHSAIFQCLEGNRQNRVEKLILTGSGGPFRTYAAEAMEHVTLAQALQHPRWTMGPKITVDSATLMNKGLEVIEARWLFDIERDRIQVVIHPESMIHSMVQYEDGSVIAQLGVPDMKIPIAYALTYPERMKSDFERIDFSQAFQMHFEKPDPDKFRCLQLAYDALDAGGSAPIVLNAANEILVGLFLKEKIRFPQITRYLEQIMRQVKNTEAHDLETILAIDKEVRKQTLMMCGEAEEE